jgi:predicted site-specific integrase-resolvase
MKLSDYAKQMGVRYETAWRWFRDGKIQGRRIGPHTIIITEGQEEPAAAAPRAAIYARVSGCPRLRTRATWTAKPSGWRCTAQHVATR